MRNTFSVPSPQVPILHVRLQPSRGESILSWLHRLAAANGYSRMHQLLRDLHLQAYRNKDLDMVSDQLFISTLSRACMIEASLLYSMSLRAMEGCLVLQFPQSAHHHWILSKPKERSGRQSVARYMVCPRCMSGIATVYWRVSWRISLQTRCHIHKTPLIDRCTACGKPFSLGLGPVVKLSACPHCLRDIRVQSKHVKDREIDFVGILSHMTGKVYPEMLPMRVAYEYQFWDGMWALMVVMRSMRFATNVLSSNFPARVRRGLNACHRHGRTSFEEWDVESRHQLTFLLGWILEGWPNRLVDLFLELRVVKSKLLNLQHAAPFWVDSIFDRFLSSPKHRVTAAEIQVVAKQIQAAGKRVSRNEIKKRLGVTESKSISEIFSTPIEQFSHRWLKLVLIDFEKDLEAAKRVRDEWASMLRDSIAILLALLSGLSFEKLVGMSTRQANLVWISKRESLDEEARILIRDAGAVWWSYYKEAVRPKFAQGNQRRLPFLITRYGVRYECNGLPGRFAETLRRVGYPHPERGCKVISDLHIGAKSVSTRDHA